MTHTLSAHQAQEKAARFATGLYDLADWLSEHDITLNHDLRILHPLSTNNAVADFAAKHGLTMTHDKEGNASTTATFGPVEFHAYGYVDFAEHRRRMDELEARRYADNNGLALVPANTTNPLG